MATTCSVCQEEFTPWQAKWASKEGAERWKKSPWSLFYASPVKVLSCEPNVPHVFHAQCFQGWANTQIEKVFSFVGSVSCPNCRNNEKTSFENHSGVLFQKTQGKIEIVAFTTLFASFLYCGYKTLYNNKVAAWFAPMAILSLMYFKGDEWSFLFYNHFSHTNFTLNEIYRGVERNYKVSKILEIYYDCFPKMRFHYFPDDTEESQDLILQRPNNKAEFIRRFSHIITESLSGDLPFNNHMKRCLPAILVHADFRNRLFKLITNVCFTVTNEAGEHQGSYEIYVTSEQLIEMDLNLLQAKVRL
ncbi:MAG: hypothetical protein HYZ47_01775 [Simkania negevensis]|nr:hypothetical protein [Simkania negevensis]